MPKPEQIYINGCTVAPGVCRGQLVVQHIHSQRIPLHVSPAAFSGPFLSPPAPALRLWTPLCQFSALHGCALNGPVKWSRFVLKKIRPQEKSRIQGRVLQNPADLTHLAQSTATHAAGRAYPGGMLRAGPGEREYLKLTPPAVECQGATASACATLRGCLHLKVRGLSFSI